MSVQLDFEHNGEIYQIIRTRKRGKKSTCELQKQTATGWESLTEMKISDTDKKIEQLLSINYETFVASSMILQGEANRFSKCMPAERKSILTQILGLDIYDKLQALAKEKERAISVKLEASKQTLESLKYRLEILPSVESDLQAIKDNITLTVLDIRAKETELSDIQAVIKDLESKQQEAKQIEKQIDTLVDELKDKHFEIGKLDVNIATAENILKSEPLITAKVAELEQIKSQIPALEARETRLRELQTEEKRLSKDEMTLADEQATLAKRITALTLDLRQKDELKLASEQHQQSLEELKVLDEKAEQWQEIKNNILNIEKELDKLAEQIYPLDSEIAAKETLLESQQKKLEILQNSGCPNPENATCKFLLDANEAKKTIPVIEKTIADFQEQIQEIQAKRNPLIEQVKDLDKQQQALNFDIIYHAKLKKQSESLRKQADLYASLSGKEELLQTVQQQHKQLDERIGVINDQVLAIHREIKALQIETENLPILKAKIPSLELYVKQKDKLPEAKATIQSAKEQISKLDAEIATKNEQRKVLQENYLTLNSEVTMELPPKKAWQDELADQLKGLQTDLNNLYVDQGTYQSKLDELNKSQVEYDRLKEELAPLAKELVRWQTLIKAFGKSGIPALIIENSIPELERISNDILSQMTNGQNSLRFDTQRDKKDGKGQIETLDIWVNDDSGYERIYETYSGGEALRIDLAIRLGLAEFLANRSGSKIEWICADEIMSSQDTEHRQLVIDAIKAIAGRFKKILVISHIPETQAAFDQRIILSEGGKIEIEFN